MEHAREAVVYCSVVSYMLPEVRDVWVRVEDIQKFALGYLVNINLIATVCPCSPVQ